MSEYKNYEVYKMTTDKNKSYIFSTTRYVEGEKMIIYYLVRKSPTGEINVERIKDTLALLENNNTIIEKIIDKNELDVFLSIIEKTPVKKEITPSDHTNSLKKQIKI